MHDFIFAPDEWYFLVTVSIAPTCDEGKSRKALWTHKII